MSNFFSKLETKYKQWNDFIYQYLVFLYYLGTFTKLLYAFFMGFLAGLSLPPTKLFFLLPIAFASVIRLTDFCTTAKQAFSIGFWFCFGFFLVGFYWVSFAVLHDLQFYWLLPIAFVGIPFVLSIYTATLFPLYLKIVEFSSAVKKILIFASLWILFEYGRYIIFQFPWNFVGYSFTFSLSMLQFTSVIGILGLSFIVILWASSFHLTFLTGDAVDFVKYFQFFLFTNILLVIIFMFGFLKLNSIKEELTDTKIRIVQGNSSINNKSKNDAQRYLSLTTSKPLDDIDYIIWPEGSIKSVFINNEELRKEITKILKNEQILVVGSLRVANHDGEYKFFNSMIFTNNKNAIFYYDKNHLVPFGEFVPFKSLLPIKAISSIEDLTRGSGLETLKLSSKVPPFAPLICYEIAFTANVISYDNIAPEWILNITNDAWYLKSSGAFQHLEIARVRAIEEGLPVVRATNSGISTAFTQEGKMLFKTKLFKEDVVDFHLPKKKGERTLFSFLGNLPLLICLFGFVIYSILDFLYIKNDKTINRLILNFFKNKK